MGFLAIDYFLLSTTEGPVTLCDFLSNLSRNAVAGEFVQCNMGCLAIFLLHFTAVLTMAHAHSSCFSFRGALRDRLLRKLHSVAGPQHQTSATCNATFSTIAR